LKYSGSGRRITVRTGKEGGFACLRVTDRGPGIPKSELQRIFKRFYRIPGPLAAKIKGTGLGLYIVRSVARRHGGKVWAESDGPGYGSTFILLLPLATNGAEAARS
jgi:signal transduction histidine kinase